MESYFRPQDPPHPTGSPKAASRADPSSVDPALPLHYIVFKQTACHLAHEAGVEQIFSRAGLLADPNLDPAHLVALVKIGFNKAVCWPSVEAIKNKYYELFRGRGAIEDDDLEDE